MKILLDIKCQSPNGAPQHKIQLSPPTLMESDLTRAQVRAFFCQIFMYGGGGRQKRWKLSWEFDV